MDRRFTGDINPQHLAMLVLDEVIEMKKEGTPITLDTMEKFNKIADIIFSYPIPMQVELHRWLLSTSS
jgi:hypothetical protein